MCTGQLPCLRGSYHVYGAVTMCTGQLPCVRGSYHVYGAVTMCKNKVGGVNIAVM